MLLPVKHMPSKIEEERAGEGSDLALVSKEANVRGCVDDILAALDGLVKGLRLIQLCLHNARDSRYGDCHCPCEGFPQLFS